MWTAKQNKHICPEVTKRKGKGGDEATFGVCDCRHQAGVVLLEEMLWVLYAEILPESLAILRQLWASLAKAVETFHEILPYFWTSCWLCFEHGFCSAFLGGVRMDPAFSPRRMRSARNKASTTF